MSAENFLSLGIAIFSIVTGVWLLIKNKRLANRQEKMVEDQEKTVEDLTTVVERHEKTVEDLTTAVEASTVVIAMVIKDLEEKLAKRFQKVGRTVRNSAAVVCLLIGLVVLTIAFGGNISSRGPTVVPANQIGHVGQPLPSPVAVQVQTNSGSVEGATVVFAPTSGDGTATPDAVVTDSAGRAQTVWTLGSQPGKQTLVARVLGGGSMSITATAHPVPPGIEITPDSAEGTR